MMQALCSFKTSGTTNTATQHHIPEDTAETMSNLAWLKTVCPLTPAKLEQYQEQGHERKERREEKTRNETRLPTL